MSPPAPMHGRAAEYLDGSLSAEDEADFLDHTASCAACEADLHAEVQLRDRETSLAEAGVAAAAAPSSAASSISSIARSGPTATVVATSRPPAAVVSLASRRRQIVLTAAAALAAAATVTIVIGARGGQSPTAPRLALAEHRSIPIRLAYAGAARHRAYDVPRGDVAPAEAIPNATIAAFQRAHDCHGTGAALLLAGELDRARQILGGCAGSPDLDADLAGLAVLRHEPEAALALADRALTARPGHPVAHWNRALALEALGRTAAAAAAFDQVVTAGDDWADEARLRAAALRREVGDAPVDGGVR